MLIQATVEQVVYISIKVLKYDTSKETDPHETNDDSKKN